MTGYHVLLSSCHLICSVPAFISAPACVLALHSKEYLISGSFASNARLEDFYLHCLGFEVGEDTLTRAQVALLGDVWFCHIAGYLNSGLSLYQPFPDPSNRLGKVISTSYSWEIPFYGKNHENILDDLILYGIIQKLQFWRILVKQTIQTVSSNFSYQQTNRVCCMFCGSYLQHVILVYEKVLNNFVFVLFCNQTAN